MAAETDEAGPRGGCQADLAVTRRPYCRDALRGGGGGPPMVVLPGGSFRMGGDQPSEQPRREVSLSRSFAISLYEISHGEYSLFCRDTGRSCPSQPWPNPGDYPVVNVSWHDAQAYTEWLSAKTGRRYRLPTEAEWEYAARGGTQTIYPFGDELLIIHARFSDVTPATTPLPRSDRSVNRNAFRLFHMVGNVREWVADVWRDNHQGAPVDGSAVTGGDAEARVVRGGSYRDPATALRSAARERLPAGQADAFTGFRVVLDFN